VSPARRPAGPRDAAAAALRERCDLAKPPFMKPPRLPVARIDPKHPGCSG
jgi:hypothetical protein